MKKTESKSRAQRTSAAAARHEGPAGGKRGRGDGGAAMDRMLNEALTREIRNHPVDEKSGEVPVPPPAGTGERPEGCP